MSKAWLILLALCLAGCQHVATPEVEDPVIEDPIVEPVVEPIVEPVTYSGLIVVDPPLIYVHEAWNVNRCHAYRDGLNPPAIMNVRSAGDVFEMNQDCLDSIRVVAQFEVVGRPWVFEHWFDPGVASMEFPTVIYVFDGQPWPPEIPQELYRQVSHGSGAWKWRLK